MYNEYQYHGVTAREMPNGIISVNLASGNYVTLTTSIAYAAMKFVEAVGFSRSSRVGLPHEC